MTLILLTNGHERLGKKIYIESPKRFKKGKGKDGIYCIGLLKWVLVFGKNCL